MKNIAIIPARGGSKRIPRKNIKDFLGKPIIAYSIQAALDSGLFDEVMVSTDDVEIAKVAIEYGAKVPFMRSNETANDFATTMDVLKEVVLRYRANNKQFDNVCCIYATAPFATSEKLKDAYKLFHEKKYDTVFPIMNFSFPIQRSLKRNDEGKIDFAKPEFANARSQDLEKRFHDAGQFYWTRSEIIETKDIMITDNTGGLIISEIEGQDIDNDTDWKLAELKYELIKCEK